MVTRSAGEPELHGHHLKRPGGQPLVNPTQPLFRFFFSCIPPDFGDGFAVVVGAGVHGVERVGQKELH